MSVMPEPAPAINREPATGGVPVFPLNEFYMRAGLPLPEIEIVAGDRVPEPYKSLLVHANDMTPTLEQFHGADIHLEILSRERRDDFYFREVVLRLDVSDKPVEFGANKISLARFSPEARRLILGEHVPLGRILKDCNVVHRTHASAFLMVHPDSLICRALGLKKPTAIYGRRAAITDAQGHPLSEIVEILPP